MRRIGGKEFNRSIICGILSIFFLMQYCHAEKADQDKPIILEAEKISVNDVKQVYDLDGDVLIIKGTILASGNKGTIKVDPEGYEYIDVTASPERKADFRQKREASNDEFMQGQGLSVIYDSKSELLTLTGDASLKRLQNMQMVDQIRGGKIEYDDVSQYYRVSPSENAKPLDPPQARAILSPRKKATTLVK